jgi:DNA-binding beta-propeller fold protein YncE
MFARRLAIVGVACACGGGGGGDPSIDARVHDARVPDDAALHDAPLDAAIDAGPDAEPPDGPGACELPAFTTGVSTLSGCSEPGTADGARGVARFSNPVNVARGPDGMLYVADFDTDRVRVVDDAGNVTTLVSQALFQRPFGLAFAEDGTFYVSTDDNDSGEHSANTGTIWRVNMGTGLATVVARDIGRPRGMVVLPDPDNRIVIADYLHHTVRIVDPDDGSVASLAGAPDMSGYEDGPGPTARFFGPYGVARLSDGRIAVADLFNHRIRAVELDGDVTTLAGAGGEGADDGPALEATFSFPQDVAVDDAGVVYVSDTNNFVIRRLAAGEVTTVVGSGTGGWLDSDDLRAAQIYGMEGIGVSADGTTLWIADGSRGEDAPHHRVRVVDLDGP